MIDPVPMTSSKPSRSRDRVGVEAVGRGRQDDPTALGLVAGNRLARAGPDVRCDLLVGETLDQRLEIARMDLALRAAGDD